MDFHHSSQSDTVQSDRLKRAIERNRAKQAKRATRSSASPRQASADVIPGESWSLPGGSSARGTRRSVGRADDSEFVTALRKAPRKAPANVSYNTRTSVPVRTTKRAVTKTGTRKRSVSSKASQRGHDILVKAAWAFCGFLLLRLIFSAGGVIDFYDSKSTLNNKMRELNNIKKENVELAHEIERIKKDSRYQKKLVRDHLGFIARDEFLILFQKEKS